MKRLFYFIFLYCLTSCTDKKKDAFFSGKKDIRIAKKVPGNYIPAADKHFADHKDTVYYDNHFFTGFRYLLYLNGDTALLQSYFNGVEEGTQKKWYPNKQLAEKRFYINGKKEGFHKSWWPDGKPKMLFESYNDEYNGEFKEWYSSGLLVKDFQYVNGYEEGSQKLCM